MTHAHYRRLLSEICALIDVPCDDALASHGTLRIADFDVLLVCDGSMPHYAAAYFDLGPLPEQGREALQADMLEINHSIGPSCKGVLSVEACSQRVLCALPFVLDELTTGRAVLDELTAFAAELKDDGQAAVGPGRNTGLPRARLTAPVGWA